MAILLFQDGGRPPSWILILVKTGVTARCGQSMSTTVPNFVTVRLLWSYCVVLFCDCASDRWVLRLT